MKEIDIYGDTNVGCVRTNNEDTFVCEQLEGGRYIVLAAIDGVGGMDKGEVAAEIARNEIIAAFADAKAIKGDEAARLKNAVIRANNTILSKISEDPHHDQMGCVLSAVVIDTQERVMTMVHIGDSRVYMYSGGSLVKLSHDHSFVGALEEAGELTEEEAMHHPQRNEILRALGLNPFGPDDPDGIEVAEFPVMGNSIFLLCSDGLTDLVDSRTIAAILADGSDAKSQVDQLIKRALAAGGKDNVTVVLAHLQYPEAETAPASTKFSAGDYVDEEEQQQQPATTEKPKKKEMRAAVDTKQEYNPTNTVVYEQKPKKRSKTIVTALCFVGLFLLGFLIGDIFGSRVVGEYKDDIELKNDSILKLNKEIGNLTVEKLVLRDSVDILTGKITPEEFAARHPAETAQDDRDVTAKEGAETDSSQPEKEG